MLDVLIVLQSHSKSNAGDYSRYCGASKLEVSKRCFLSLINTMEHCRVQQPEVTYRMVVVDDRSDAEFLELVRGHNIEVIESDTPGIMPNILKMYETGKTMGQQLIYFAQDDYLHYHTALWEMLDAYFQFTQLTGKQVCIYPYDDPYRYSLLHYNQKIVLGARRHWRTAYHTACGFMMSYQTLIENWSLFETLGKSQYDRECEDRSINKLFINMMGEPLREITHLLFTPIPSLALHLGDDSTQDPYVDWQPLWDQFSFSQSSTVR